ncbi:Histone deacetylase-like amidohydrolase [compost metagenome]
MLTVSLHQEGCFPAGYGGAADRGEGAGEGCNLNIPLLPGGGHDAYLYAFERLVVPALARFRPQLIVVACGYDANAVDPLARMLAHSGTFRALTARLRQVAEEFAEGRLVLVHEGGYSEAYVPFCGQAVIEALAGVSTAVEDPLLGFIEQQQPNAEVRALQRRLLDRQAEDWGL